VDVTKFLLIQLLPLAFEVGDLPGDQLEGTGRLREFEDCDVMRIALSGLGISQDFEGLSQEGVSSQNGDAFANSEFNSNQFIAPTDDINGVINFTTIISPVMFNWPRTFYSSSSLS